MASQSRHDSIPQQPQATRPAFFGLAPAELDELVAGWGWPKFRGQQVREWVYGKLAADPSRMTNLAKRDQDLLGERLVLATSTVTTHQASSDGTQKLLLTWPDGSVA